MSSKTTVSQSGGISFCSLLAILFIGLKLTGFIAWSWWWVLSPLGLPILFIFAVWAVFGLIALVVSAVDR